MTISLDLDDTNLMVNYIDTNGDIWQDSISLSDLRQALNIKPPVDELYEAYKEWWIEEMASDYVGTHWGKSPEECFTYYMSTLSLKDFIETLSEFSYGENT